MSAVSTTPSVASTAAGPDRIAHRGHRRIEATVEQDQNERRRPDLIGEMIILEWDLPDPFRAGEHADGEKPKRERDAQPRRSATERHRDRQQQAESSENDG